MMDIQRVQPATESVKLLSEPVQTFARSCSQELQVETSIRTMVQKLESNEQAQTLLAVEGTTVIGWISFVAWSQGYVTLHPLKGAKVGWPTVAPGVDEMEVGQALLTEVVRELPSTSKTILMCIDDDIEVSDEEVAVLQERYQALGYHYTHLAHYCTTLGSEPAISLPPDVRIEPLKAPGKEALSECILDAFSGPAGQFFFGDSAEERDQYVAGLLDSPASQEPASSVIYVGDRLAGFVSAVGYDTNLLIDWLGIRADWQRRGLGSLLLHHALETGRANGYATASGSANVANGASMRLMESLGWEKEGGERQFVLVL